MHRDAVHDQEREAMNRQRTTLKGVIDASLCRRRHQRRKVHAIKVTSWVGQQAPMAVNVIEADVKGARLIFPFHVTQGERVQVSFENELGFFETRTARIAWTQPLNCGGRVVAGLAFDEELSFAA